MKKIKASDLKIIKKEVEKEVEWKPKFLGMKKKDIHRIKKGHERIHGYDKDGNEVYYENSYGDWNKKEYKDGYEVYYENSNRNWWKKDGDNTIEFINNKYYLNGEEAELK